MPESGSLCCQEQVPGRGDPGSSQSAPWAQRHAVVCGGLQATQEHPDPSGSGGRREHRIQDGKSLGPAVAVLCDEVDCRENPLPSPPPKKKHAATPGTPLMSAAGNGLEALELERPSSLSLQSNCESSATTVRPPLHLCRSFASCWWSRGMQTSWPLPRSCGHGLTARLSFSSTQGRR